MNSVISEIEKAYKKSAVVDVRSGDTVKVHQKIREGGKERVQIFQGLVIKTKRKGSHTSGIVVRRIASGVGVEKGFLIHSPLVLKIEIVKRSKVRRNYLTYMRQRTGKSARLSSVDFDREGVNVIHDEKAEAEEEKLHELAEEAHEKDAAKKAAKEEKVEKEVEAVKQAHTKAEKEVETKK
ncbi:MAG TPA: 50S ribosomal protein L19 [Candidatus Saccharimonadales bacterium]|nr:50S ribosomal protein L19 [Candidatus Saccharimonadales bacterium]